MPLYIKDVVVKKEDLQSLQKFLHKYEAIFEKPNKQLKTKDAKRISSDMDHLYVNQREMAAVASSDKCFSSIGTDMMTTCHAAVLHCEKTKATALAHFDGCATFEGVRKMIELVAEISHCDVTDLSAEQVYNLHIVGGFEDDRGISEDLSLELLQAFTSEFPGSPQIHLQTFCVTSLNQKLIGEPDELIKSPVVFGLAVDIRSGAIYSVVFDDDAKEPVAALRGAKSFHGPNSMLSLYDWKNEEVVIPPFTYGKFARIDVWLQQPDDVIRKYLSTSPEVEPDNFVDHIRQCLRFIRKNPSPMESIFKGSRPLRFKKVGRKWKKL